MRVSAGFTLLIVLVLAACDLEVDLLTDRTLLDPFVQLGKAFVLLKMAKSLGLRWTHSV